MAAYDAIIFDLFGTLVKTVTPADYEGMVRSLADVLGAPQDAFHTQWRASVRPRESGELGDVAQILRTTSLSVGCTPEDGSVHRAKEVWLDKARAWLEPRASAAATVRSFRDAGLRIGLISNCSAEVPPTWADSPLLALVDAAVFSCEVGMMKPDPRIYRHTCALLDVTPERCLFVGDGGARELTGARDVGMHAVLLRVTGEEHTWFDANYRLDALEWRGATIGALEELPGLVDPGSVR